MLDDVVLDVEVMDMEIDRADVDDDMLDVIVLAPVLLLDGDTDVGSTEVEVGVVEIDVEVVHVMVLVLLAVEVWFPKSKVASRLIAAAIAEATLSVTVPGSVSESVIKPTDVVVLLQAVADPEGVQVDELVVMEEHV